ncbi:MAG: hypothetical protein EYC70_01725 [Planctomycetota bacterium]|nr:MAG: hypothetical protein EYC70_01725 [Planctomycetota bacterium]
MPRAGAAPLCLATLWLAACQASGDELTVLEHGGAYEVRQDGALFTVVHAAAAPRPYLYPVLGPDGVEVTRAYPIAERPGEPTDHPHHVSLWYAHGSVNGHDFWQGGDGARIACVRAEILQQGGAQAAVRLHNRWIAGGETILTEERTLRFSARDGVRWIDADITLIAPPQRAVVLGDTKEGSFALRLRHELALRGEGAAGHCYNSEGQRDAAVWGKRAAWVCYSGPVEGRTLSVAVFDHPRNPRYPTWWHARDYGLVAANPFGAHDFEGVAPGTGDLRLAPGERVRFRYRVALISGLADPAALDALASGFVSD